MKKIICFLLAIAMITVCCLASVPVQAESDRLMLYDGEGDLGNGFQDPWGRLSATDDTFYTEGTSGYAMQSFFNGVYFFQNTLTYLGYAPDLEGYDYIEFDMLSYDDIVCDLELSVVNNVGAHHGSDYEMFDVFMPAQTFVHVKMPLKDFVTHSVENRDKYDTQEDAGADEPHYAGYSLNKCARLRWQMTYVKYVEKGVELEDMDAADDLYIVFDNVYATKNGATHEHQNPDMEVVELQYWADAKEEYNKVDEPSQVEPSLPEPSKPNESKPDSSPVETFDYGDVNGQGGVNAADALLVLQTAVNKATLSEKQAIKADVNGDSKIDASDALLILRFSVEKIHQFPVEEKA